MLIFRALVCTALVFIAVAGAGLWIRRRRER
jgi:uncharacterized iron-regulated membrane protein